MIIFGKKNNFLKLYEDFREKIISVENLVQSKFCVIDLLNFYWYIGGRIIELKIKINE